MLKVAPLYVSQIFKNYTPFEIEIIEWFYSERLRHILSLCYWNHTGNYDAVYSVITSWPLLNWSGFLRVELFDLFVKVCFWVSFWKWQIRVLNSNMWPPLNENKLPNDYFLWRHRDKDEWVPSLVKYAPKMDLIGPLLLKTIWKIHPY